jgi:protein-L-isoaspartate(D-aspartate) O-methyltransferase
MTQALNVQPRDTVLEIGTGSGYQAAILAQLGRRIYTVDRHRRLVREAQGVFFRVIEDEGEPPGGFHHQGPLDEGGV